MSSLDNKHKSQIFYKNEICKIYSLITLGIFSFIYDFYMNKKEYQNCKKKFFTFLIKFLHHIFCSFLYFGWIFSDKNILILYIITLFVTVIVQSLNNNKCPSTQYVNKNCNLSKLNFFRDVLYYTKVKSKNFYNITITIFFLIAFYKLSKI
jgi:hypothetical protein